MNKNARAHIVVVDPETACRERILKHLRERGHSCQGAESVSEARERVLRQEPELLISELNVGGDCGLRLLANLETNIYCPAIFTSSSRETELESIVQNSGATYFLQKPLDWNALTETVDTALQLPRRVCHYVHISNVQLSSLHGGSLTKPFTNHTIDHC